MKRLSIRGARLAVLGAVVLGSLVVAGTASAQAGSNTSATGLIFNGGRTATADCPPGGGATNPGGTFGLVTVGLLTARCTDVDANASAATVTVGTLQLQAVQSQCTTGPNGTASSSVLVVSGGGPLNGQVISTPTTIDAGNLITVRLNEVVNEPGFRTANAVHITAVGQDIIIAQARCSTTAAYPLRAGLGVGSDLGAQPLSSAVTQSGDGDAVPRRWFFWSAGAVLLVALATFLLTPLRLRHASRR